jgi:hypothetical protein
LNFSLAGHYTENTFLLSYGKKVGKPVYLGLNLKVLQKMVGQDIYKQLKDRGRRRRSGGDIVLLPPRVLNHDGFFLDNWTVSQLENSLGKPCHVFQEPLSELFNVLKRITVK